MWPFVGSGSRRPAVANSSSGDLYVFSERKLMKYDPQKNVWTAVVSLPQHFISAYTCATQWRDWIFCHRI